MSLSAMNRSAMSLSAIIAASPSGIIGRDGDMPWRLSSDLRRFKRLTMGAILIMGRTTFDSIGRPLPGRRTFVLTRNAQWSHEGVETFADCQQALAACGDDPAFVVGGAQIYQQFLPLCQRLLLTRVWTQVAGDTSVTLDLAPWRCEYVEPIPASPRDSVPSEFSVWHRIDTHASPSPLL